ncbi:unnamed protein product [Symbiodinium sp. CCMP2592]|nr:unnamed protein product [Symbiodinium sp. CCMP2592]
MTAVGRPVLAGSTASSTEAETSQVPYASSFPTSSADYESSSQDRALPDDVFGAAPTPERMLSLALGQPEHWSLRERPTASVRSHARGTCLPCVFFVVHGRCHFGDRCGCCHDVSHRNPATLQRFQFAASDAVRQAVRSDPEGKPKGNSSSEGPSLRPPIPKAQWLHAGEGAHWRSLGLSDWLDDIDQGKGLLNQYRARLLAHFDSLEQILGLYMVRRSDGHWTLDQLFFHDLKIDKVGHRRLFEKWFKNRCLDGSRKRHRNVACIE